MGRAIMKRRAVNKGIWGIAHKHHLSLLLGYKVVALELGAEFCHGRESKLEALVLLQCELPNVLCTLELSLSCPLLFIQVSLHKVACQISILHTFCSHGLGGMWAASSSQPRRLPCLSQDSTSMSITYRHLGE